MLEHACRMGLEGVISKRRDLPYQPGRTNTWLKTKCIARQEFVIGGFTDPEGSREGIGALLIGFYDKNHDLIFAGKVGTGFTQKGARELRKRLDRLEQQICPFATRPAGPLGRNAHWVRPELLGEVAFSEWTGEGRIRHPSFQGLREDKRPVEVKLERPST
jgi:bifunctional non-homologous end joining protein LigD